MIQLAAMTEDTPPKRLGRPPLPGGPKPARHARIGAVWDEAIAVATERGETMTAFVERALERELRRLRRVERRG